jgi:hypothetical protein
MAPAYDETRFISERQFNTVTCAMVAIASIFTIARVYIQVWKRRPMQSQDYLLYVAFVFFLIMSICYILMAPKIYMIGQVSKGLVRPPETLTADVVWCTRVIFVSQTSFLLALSLVKLSLLALYRKLIKGLPIMYLRIWWAVLVFCLLVSRSSMSRDSAGPGLTDISQQSLCGCVISVFTVCDDFTANMRVGCCKGARSLYGM